MADSKKVAPVKMKKTEITVLRQLEAYEDWRDNHSW